MAAGWRLAERSQEDVERLIREQAREIERLQRELEGVERERDRYRRERDELEKEPETARRAAKRQAAPFSKGAPTPTPRRPGRKPGREYGPRAWRPVPAAIDEVVEGCRRRGARAAAARSTWRPSACSTRRTSRPCGRT